MELVALDEEGVPFLMELAALGAEGIAIQM
jgi:hypothetical protein